MRHSPHLRPIKAACARLPAVAFALAASLPLLLLAMLAIGLLLGTAGAQADSQNRAHDSGRAETLCEGENLAVRLGRTNPEALAKARADAAAVPNGAGRLWKLEKPGIAPSWLFGTMHITDPRVVRMPDAARAAFDAARTVAIETIDILDPAKAQAALMARPELTMFTDGNTLVSFLDEEDARLVETELARRGIPLALVSRMKPWMVAGMLALPQCELARKSDGAVFLDIKIANDARGHPR
jgi:uncharacterized protein YbaP (TraB family)